MEGPIPKRKHVFSKTCDALVIESVCWTENSK